MKFNKFFLLLLSLSLVAAPRIATAQPSEIEILFQQGSAAQEAGNYAEAEAIWRKLLQIEPDVVAAYNNLGLALAEQGKWEEAVTSYRRAIELDPNFAPAHSNLGNILKQQGKLEEAASHYRRAIEIEPTASRYGYLGEVLSELGNIEEAIDNYRRAIGIDPDLSHIHYYLGNALYERGNVEDAIYHYRRAVELNPRSAPAYGRLGSALSDQGKLQEAIAYYRLVIQLEPDSAAAHNNLGILLKRQGNLEEAISHYRRAIELDPNFALAHNNLGLALFEQGNLEEAIASYRRAIELDASYSSAYNNLGDALRKQGDLEAAIEAYQEAISIKPDFIAARDSLQETQNLAANQPTNQPTDQPLDQSTTQSASQPTDQFRDQPADLPPIDVLTQQGELTQEAGNYAEAEAIWRRVLELDPNNVTARSNLGIALVNQGRLAEAIEILPQDSAPVGIDDQQYLPSRKEQPLLPILRSTVLITAQTFEETSIGTGWVVKQENSTVWIVTNSHVIDNLSGNCLSNQVTVEFFSLLPDYLRPKYSATVVNCASDLDLAVLTVENAPKDIQPLEYEIELPFPGTEVWVIGHNAIVKSLFWTPVQGRIMNSTELEIYIDANIGEGNSGGPVTDISGQRVVAMVVRIIAPQDPIVDPNQVTPDLTTPGVTRGAGIAYPMQMVEQRLREWGILN